MLTQRQTIEAIALCSRIEETIGKLQRDFAQLQEAVDEWRGETEATARAGWAKAAERGVD